MRNEIELAYCAGVLDSDGFITIHRQRPNPKFENSITFSEALGVTMTSDVALELFAARWGGNIRQRKRPGKEWKPISDWIVTNRKAITCVTDLLPFLRVKRRQAEIILALRASKGQPNQRVRIAGTVRASQLDPAIFTERDVPRPLG